MRTFVASLALMLALGATASRGGTIAGTLTLASGISGDLANTRIAIYASYDDWNGDLVMRMVAPMGFGPQVVYSMANVLAGTYYLDAWKDNDADTLWDDGDFYGIWGSYAWPVITPVPVFVADGQTTAVDLIIYVLGPPVPTREVSWGRVKALYR